MPIFEYSCKRCGKQFEQLQKSDCEVKIECPACGSADVEKAFSTFSGASCRPASSGGG
jgi:putative FmdB family regulatory protein